MMFVRCPAKLLSVTMLLAPVVADAAPATRTITLAGTPTHQTRRALRRALAPRRIRLLSSGRGQLGESGPASKPGAAHVRRTEQVVRQATDLYYVVEFAKATVLLTKEVERSSGKLVLAGRIDLLQQLHLWRGVCLLKQGDDTGAMRAFSTAAMLGQGGPDPARFPPEVVRGFIRARETVNRRRWTRLTLDISPHHASVEVGGRGVLSAISLRRGHHWLVARAVGYRTVVRRIAVGEPQARVAFSLEPAPLAVVRGQLARLRAEGALDPTRVDVASALGRLRGTRETLAVAERESRGRVRLTLQRIRCADGRVIARTETTVDPRRRGRAVARAVRVLWSAPVVRRTKPLYKRWWVWTAVGVAVVAGAIAVGLAVDTPPMTYAIRLAPPP